MSRPDPSAKRGSQVIRVVVVALTYQRHDDVRELVPVLLNQAEKADASVRILVVDNDPHGDAREIVAEAAAGRPVAYLHAAIPGIAAARNAALDDATDDDLLVFIDDDERPTDGWLDLLLATWQIHRSAAVVGPVVSQFAVEPESWITAGRYFDRRRLPTGTTVDLAATNNLLLDMKQVTFLGLRFDERFGLTGGSDTLFTRQLHARGGRMVWCDEAVVIDVVPENRITRKWVVQRAFRAGNTWMRTSLVLAQSPRLRLIKRVGLAARGGVRVVGGAGRLAVGVVTRRESDRARGIRTMARGAGLVAGSWGSVYSEYRRA